MQETLDRRELFDRYIATLGRPLTEAEEYAFVLVATRDDPASFNRLALGRTLWSKQEEVCRSVARYPTTVVPAGRAVGKSYLLAGLCLWWLYTRPGSLVVITGPNHRLVVSVIFKEIGRALKNNPAFRLGYEHLSEGYASPQRLTVDESTKWGVLGFAASNPSNLSGQHAADLLCIVDEAVGVSEDLFGSIHGLAAQRLVVTGNPTSFDCHFRTLHDLAMAGSTTINSVPISSMEAPDAENEHSPVGMACGSFLRQMAEIHGTESQWWKSNILGLFPGQESTRFFPRQWLEYCSNESMLTDPLWLDTPPGPRLMGVDVGGGVGADRSVVTVRDRKQLLDVFASPWHGVLDDARERLEPIVVAMARKWDVSPDNITYDKGGIGRSFSSYLAKYGIDGAFGYFGAGRGGPKYANRRTANIHAFRYLINPNRDTFCGFYTGGIPEWPAMQAELAEIREIEDEYDEGEPKAAIETKEALMARIKKSPDLSDSLCMTMSRV